MGFALSCTRPSKSNTPSIDKDSSVGQVARGGDREDDVDPTRLDKAELHSTRARNSDTTTEWQRRPSFNAPAT